MYKRQYKRTIKDALKQVGIELGSKDKVEPALEKKLVKDEVIEVRKAVNVEIVSKDKTISIMTAEPTIGAMLEAESEKLKAENIEFDKYEEDVYKRQIFILGAIISFSTGSAYGTMSILMPLAIPLAYKINPEMSFVIVSTSAVLTGAIFGDHCSPISDTTILSSMGAGCSHIDHVKTQMWYALFVAAITILFGYIPAGFGLPIYIVLPM